MSRVAYPTDSDIETFVVSCGITVPSTFSFAGYGAAASDTWEQTTGWLPFLRDSVATARYFNPPGTQPINKQWSNYQYGGGRILNLYAGIPTLADLTSVVCTGTVNLPTTNFFMAPINSPNIGRPFTRIEFIVPYWGTANTTVVTANWGFNATIPEDAWQAILRIGANLAAFDLLEAILLSPDTVKIGSASVTQDTSKVSMASAPWSTYAKRVADRYMFTNQGLLP